MKCLICLAVLALSAPRMLAARPDAELPAPVSGPSATFADVSKSAAATEPQGIGVGGYGFGNRILVAVVINAPGQNGTFFHTDYFLSNGRSVTQEFIVFFLAAGVNNATVTGQRFVANPNTTYSISDYLGSGSGRINKSGVGSLYIYAVISGTNTVDSGGLLYGAARIWTNEPGSSGTNSFTLWAQNPHTIHGDFQAIAVGGRQNSSFRCNFGLVNLDLNFSRTWTVTFIGNSGSSQQTVTIQPFSMQELAVPAGVGGGDGYILVVFTPSDTADFEWTAFVVSADNITGDAWLSPAVLLPVSVEY